MKKSSYRFAGIAAALCLMVLFPAGCGSQETQNNDTVSAAQENSSLTESVHEISEDITDVEQEETESQVPENNDDLTATESQSTRNVTIYYVDDLSGSVIGKQTEVTDEYDIWDALIQNGILTEDCQLLGMTVNESEKTIALDFNTETADRINSFGTTGQTEITGCMINTYLDAYACTGIRLTENGQDFVSSHGVDFGGYTERVVFE